jgi:hypothetical protein
MDPLPLARLRAADLAVPDVQFTDGQHRYVTSGTKLGHGGMGNVWTLTRLDDSGGGKTVVG